MNIIPAIDLRGGRVVQLIGGDPEKVGVVADNDPVQQANLWRQKGARRLHVVDLDAAFGEKDQWVQLGRILATGAKVQFGGGIRSMLQIQQLLNLGVGQIIVGTQGVENSDWLRELALLWPGRVILAVDAHGRDIMIKGWTKRTGRDVVEVARTLDDAQLGGFLYTNVAKEGRLEGIDADVVQDLVDATPNTPLIVSGGITDDADLETLAGLGVDSVVLGMSIYTDRIDLQAAIARHEGVAA